FTLRTSERKSFPYTTLFRSDLEYDRMVTRNKDKWEDYGVTDETGINVTVSGKSGTLSTFVVGAPRGGEAFLRSRDADEVYTVNADRKSTRLNSSHVKISYAV